MLCTVTAIAFSIRAGIANTSALTVARNTIIAEQVRLKFLLELHVD